MSAEEPVAGMPRSAGARRGPPQAAYTALPIFRAAMDFAVAIDGATARFARRHRYGIGEELRRASMQLLLAVPRANRREGRVQALRELCDAAEDAKLLLNLGKELAAFQSFAEYARLVDEVVNLARQAEGWRRHSEASARPERGASASGERQAPGRSG